MRNAHMQTMVAKLMSYVPSDDVTYHRQYIQVRHCTINFFKRIVQTRY